MRSEEAKRRRSEEANAGEDESGVVTDLEGTVGRIEVDKLGDGNSSG
jgi:hypothetical protein